MKKLKSLLTVAGQFTLPPVIIVDFVVFVDLVIFGDDHYWCAVRIRLNEVSNWSTNSHLIIETNIRLSCRHRHLSILHTLHLSDLL